MSQSNDEAPVTPEELAKAFVPEEPEKEEEAEKEAKDTVDNTDSDKKDEKKPEKKKKSKAIKWTILIIVWVLLLGGAVGLAFLFRPKVELQPAEEVFRWDEKEREKTEYTNMSYYSFYNTNDITFEYPWRNDYESHLSSVPQISGLINQDVQNKVNQRILDAANSLLQSGYSSIYVRTGANLYNVLSILLRGATYGLDVQKLPTEYVGLNFDLNTGEEITFDDIFVKGANVKSTVFKRIYDNLSISLGLSLMSTERAIHEITNGVCAMYCSPDISLEEYNQLKQNDEALIASIEEIATKVTDNYLAGKKGFFLESAGPVFIYTDDTNYRSNSDSKLSKRITDYFTSEDYNTFAYLTKYRSQESLFVDDSVGIDGKMLSSLDGSYKTWAVENNDYLMIIHAENNAGIESIITDEVIKRLLKEVLESKQNEYLVLTADISVNKASGWENIYSIRLYDSSVYEMSKADYNSWFRKNIFDIQSKAACMSNIQVPACYKSLFNGVEEKKDYGRTYYYAFADGVSEIVFYETVEELFLPDVEKPCTTMGEMIYCKEEDSSLEEGWTMFSKKDWRRLLIEYYYANIYEWDAGQKVFLHYTDEEKEKHEFEFSFEYGLYPGIEIKLKNEGEKRHIVSLYMNRIPKEYFIEEFR